MPRVAFLALLVLVASALPPQSAAAAAEHVVFHYDESWRPVVRLDRLPSDPGVRAILAVYSLENGAGCQGKNSDDLVNCQLTRDLGLGANCSAEHIGLVRAWFDTTPNLTSRWQPRDAATQEPGSLEGLCYRQPDSASWQNIWEIIRLRQDGKLVHINAVLFWGSAYGKGRMRYVHTFRIDGHRIVTVASKKTELSRSTKSMHE